MEKCKLIEGFLSKFVLLKENSHYRFSDIINKNGKRWKYDWDIIKDNPKYKDTILGEYINSHNKKDRHRHNLFEIVKIINEHGKKNNYEIPDENELVIHLRIGDQAYNKNFMSNKYCSNLTESANKILLETENIKKVTFVGAFAYQVWTEESIQAKLKNQPTWEYSDEIQQINLDRLTYLFETFLEKIKLPIRIYSNKDIDRDIAFCVTSKYYIPGQSGFSNFLNKLALLNRQSQNFS